jgi:hypothetical protein
MISCITSTSNAAETSPLAHLKWLEGYWVQHTTDGSQITVQWSPADGDAMVGTWRKTKAGKMVAYEMLTMRNTDNNIVYRFDMYRASDGFKNASSSYFTLVNTADNKAIFMETGSSWQLTIEITEAGNLMGYMQDTNKPDGPVHVGYDAVKQ